MSRTRVSDSRVFHTNTTEWRPYGSQTYGPSSGQWTGAVSTMIDTVTPLYRKRIAAGEIIMNDCNLYRTSRVAPSATATFPVSWGSVICTGDLLGLLEPSGVNCPLDASSRFITAKNMASCQAFARLNQSSLLAGEMVATMGQTVSMLRRPFAGAGKLLAEMRRFRSNRMKRFGHSTLRASSDTWLEYRYGWRPLISDGQTIIEIVGSQDSKRKRLVGRGFQKVDMEESSNTSYGDQAVPGTHGAELHQSAKLVGGVSTGVIADVIMTSNSDTVAAHLGLRARDVPTTIWELIPYSFVVDWFVNVGQWIEAIVPNPNLVVQGSWATEVSNITRSFTGEARITDAGVTTWRSLGTSTFTSNSVIRTRTLSLPTLPVLTAKPLTTLHALDAVALIGSQLVNSIKSFKH